MSSKKSAGKSPEEAPDAPARPGGLGSPENPQDFYRQMHQRCPVSRSALGGGALISGYSDALWALRHPEVFSSEMDIQLALGTERPMIPQQIDPPRQTKFRKLLDPFFSRRRMSAIKPDIQRHANQLIDGFIGERECEFNSAFAVPLPCTAFLRLMGLPIERLDEFLELKDGIIRPSADNFEEAARIRSETGKKIYSVFEDLISERRSERRAEHDDLMSHLLDARIDGAELTREEILDISFLMLLGGLDTVTASIGCCVAYLAENSSQRRRIVEDPNLIPSAVEELLRWETPVAGVPRVVKQDVEFAGVDLKAGEVVMILLGAADVDGAEFPEPEKVDFERARNRHLAFGGGAHRCLGSHLARLEIVTALEELHKRLPDYRIKTGETPRYSQGIREVQYLPLVW